jgi:hypothetical protein
MRARANDETPMTGMDWAALALCVVLVVWILMLLGPALDSEWAFDAAKIAAHKASLVAQ